MDHEGSSFRRAGGATRLALLIALSLASGLATRASGAGVIVVDPAGGPGAALLQTAVDAAQPGDILLLEAGDYTGQIVSIDKALSIVAETGTRPELSGLSFTGPGSGGTSVVRGLDVVAGFDTAVAFSAGGSVMLWIEDCRVFAGGTSDPFGAGVGLHSPTAGALAVIRCDVHGGDGFDADPGAGGAAGFAQPGGDAISLLGRDLVMQESQAVGGHGGDGPHDQAFVDQGGAGLGAFLADLSLLGCTLIGGDEGQDNQPSTKSGPAVLGFLSTLTHRQTSFVPGAVHGAGVVAQPISGLVTTLQEYPASLRSLRIASPVRELELAAAQVQGERGDHAYALLSPTMQPTLLPAKQGTLLPALAPAALLLPLGVITDASGTLGVNLEMPRLPVGTDGAALFTQLIVLSPDGELLVGSGSAVHLLSATL